MLFPWQTVEGRRAANEEEIKYSKVMIGKISKVSFYNEGPIKCNGEIVRLSDPFWHDELVIWTNDNRYDLGYIDNIEKRKDGKHEVWSIEAEYGVAKVKILNECASGQSHKTVHVELTKQQQAELRMHLDNFLNREIDFSKWTQPWFEKKDDLDEVEYSSK